MINFPQNYNSIMVLGPTAVGKTGLAVELADYYSGEIISADSRQVYTGLDIGSGKDLAEYTLDKGTEKERLIPYHLIDIADVRDEYNVYKYQKDFFKVFADLQNRKVLPVICGGTGMYLDAIVRGYDLLDVPFNQELRDELDKKTDEELVNYLVDLKAKVGIKLHNNSDTTERHRLIKAIEIESFSQSDEGKIEREKMAQRPKALPVIIGTTFERSVLRERVTIRLKARLEEGMIEEVQSIHDGGVSWERLERLGLEYKFVSEFLEGKISTKEELFQKLNTAIHQFVKRQETWYRFMEKNGVKIHWLSRDVNLKDNRCKEAIEYINSLI